MIRNFGADRQVGVRRIGQRQVRNYLRIDQRYVSRIFERYALPDADVPVADAGNPVPTLGTDEGRAVEA